MKRYNKKKNVDLPDGFHRHCSNKCFEDYVQLFLNYLDKIITVYEMYGHITGKRRSTVI